MAANQGSRAGLITTVVILSIASVVAIIFAFWYAAERNKLDQNYNDLKKRYQDVIADSALNGPEVQDLKTLRSAAESGFTPQTKLWDIAIAQRNQLVKLVTGADASQENTAGAAVTKATATLQGATDTVKSANTSLPSTSDNLLGAVNVLADKVKAQAGTIADRDTKLEEADRRALEAIRLKDSEVAARDKQLADIRAEYATATKQLEEARSRNEGVVGDIRKTYETDTQTQREAADKLQLAVSDRDTQIKQLKDQLAKTQARFDRIRVGVTDPMVRTNDGVISGFGGKDIVYIDLGQGKHMVPGMTFEVYDKNRGIPKIDDPLAQELPLGKASIEVIRVLEGSSECRITRQQPGMQIIEGDPILNIVYDPNTQYGIVVWGKFDLDRNGVATAEEANVVRRMVSQWGGKLLEPKDASGKIRLSVDTDFVVMGAEPVVRELTEDEINDPIATRKQQIEKADAAAYEEVLQQAKDLHIPILNQNRFLAFTGQQALANR